MIFSPEDTQKLTEKKGGLETKWTEVQTSYLKWKLSNKQAREYLQHGFLRRLGTIVRCVQNTFTICPLEQDRKLSREEEIDLRIQLQGHVVNVFGCLDNLAWIWVYEKNIKDKGKDIHRNKVGLVKKCSIVRESLPKNVSKYLEEQADWLDEFTDLRDALAHRISLYIPPYFLTSAEADQSKALDTQIWTALGQKKLDEAIRLETEKDALGRFRPVIAHASEKGVRIIGFHHRMLLDFEIITELADKFSTSF